MQRDSCSIALIVAEGLLPSTYFSWLEQSDVVVPAADVLGASIAVTAAVCGGFADENELSCCEFPGDCNSWTE